MAETNGIDESPATFQVGSGIDWAAPWTEVFVRTELPFWLMVRTGDITVDLNGHRFLVSISDHFYEFHIAETSDSKERMLYIGPISELDKLSEAIQEVRRQRPDLHIVRRKCKTTMRIVTRCNASVASNATEHSSRVPGDILLYLQELCRAHIPIINEVIRAYRLATYDFFPYEVSPWDVPYWQIDFGTTQTSICLVRYKDWDRKPLVKPLGKPIAALELTTITEVQSYLSLDPSPGEVELLDALNLRERGDFAGAVRRVVTAIEVIVEARVSAAITEHEGNVAAQKFIKDTRMNFDRRVRKIISLAGRDFHQDIALKNLRKLRNSLVHDGLRFDNTNRSQALMAVDVGRWIYNWFENDTNRIDVREKRIAMRSLGREMNLGLFKTVIDEHGVTLSPG